MKNVDLSSAPAESRCGSLMSRCPVRLRGTEQPRREDYVGDKSHDPCGKPCLPFIIADRADGTGEARDVG
jgi:hypothetical protein